MIKPWNAETSIANDAVRVVKFYLETNEGPSEITAIVNKGVSIEEAKRQMRDSFEESYKQINPNMKLEILRYEILRFIDDDDDLSGLNSLDDL